jgi:hypothetical protein
MNVMKTITHVENSYVTLLGPKIDDQLVYINIRLHYQESECSNPIFC